MSTFAPYKVVSALPTPLVADAMYAVRVGTGFDLYLVDSSGANAFKINGGDGVLRRTDITATGTTNLTLLSTTRRITLTGCAAGNSGGKYASSTTSGGASGAHIINLPVAVSGSETLTIVIGVGGAGVTANQANGVTGNAGGDTTVSGLSGGTITLLGGVASAIGTPQAFAGLVVPANLVGNCGTNLNQNGGYLYTGAGSSTASAAKQGGSFLGFAGGLGTTGSGCGGAASYFGAGGTGGGATSGGDALGAGAGGGGTNSGTRSGAGGDGRMIITEWSY